jgi:hypothetical protein
MRLKIVFIAVAGVLLASGVYAAPFDTNAMVKACVLDNNDYSGTVTTVLSNIGAIKKGEMPKISPVTIRKDAVDKNGDGDYEIVAALDYGNGRVKATALLTCTYMPHAKPHRLETTVWGLLMTEPTLYVMDNTGNGDPPSYDGNRGKIWKQFKIKNYEGNISDHPE